MIIVIQIMYVYIFSIIHSVYCIGNGNGILALAVLANGHMIIKPQSIWTMFYRTIRSIKSKVKQSLATHPPTPPSQPHMHFPCKTAHVIMESLWLIKQFQQVSIIIVDWILIQSQHRCIRQSLYYMYVYMYVYKTYLYRLHIFLLFVYSGHLP